MTDIKATGYTGKFDRDKPVYRIYIMNNQNKPRHYCGCMYNILFKKTVPVFEKEGSFYCRIQKLDPITWDKKANALATIRRLKKNHGYKNIYLETIF